MLKGLNCSVCSRMLVGNHFKGTIILVSNQALLGPPEGRPPPQVKQWTVIKLDDFVPCKPDSRDPLGAARARDGMPEALYAHPHGKETWVTCPNLRTQSLRTGILYDIVRNSEVVTEVHIKCDTSMCPHPHQHFVIYFVFSSATFDFLLRIV